jgi:alkylation response protein AidB-like acyl-CoA dehydrogenase
MERAVGESLKLLGKIAANPMLEKLGLTDQLKKALYRGSKATVSTATEAVRLVRPVVKLLEPARMRPATESAEPKAPSLFDITFTDSQELVHDTIAAFARERVRDAALAADEACGVDPAILDEAHELGLTQLAVPEALGGAGEARSMTTNVIVAEDLARGDMGIAVAALAPLGVVNALVDFGTAEQQGAYLPAFIGDKFFPASMALMEGRPLFDPHHLSTRATLNGGDYVISGTKVLVPLAADAEVVLVVADLGGKPQAFLVDKAASGLTVEAEPSMGLRAAKLGRMRFDHVRVPKSARLGGEEGIDGERLIDLSRIAWSALAVGQCDAMVDYVRQYAKERSAFGEPIAHRQSVAFTIADMALERDAMRLMVYRAASRAEHGLKFRREAFLARLQCAEKAMQIGTNGVQMLGGAGFVKDHPVELWYRHLRAVGVFEGAVSV